MKNSLSVFKAFAAISLAFNIIACSPQRSSQTTVVTPTNYQNPPNDNLYPAPANDGTAIATTEGIATGPLDDDLTPAPDRPVASYQTFYDELSPYGRWVTYPGYGYVWAPNAEADFHPYGSNGHWVYTAYGWTWASGYRWGWAPFHYGRWAYDASYGWLWTPGNVWGPAWVSWRQSSTHYGWAPLGPQVGVNISASFGSGYSCPTDHYVFVQSRYIDREDMHNYYENRSRNTTIINNTTVINNYVTNNNTTVNRTYVAGPTIQHVQAATGNRVNIMNFSDSKTSGATTVNNNTVNIYRPRVADPSVNYKRQAPTSAVPLSNLQQLPQGSRLTPNTPRVIAQQNIPAAAPAPNRNYNNYPRNNNTPNPTNSNATYGRSNNGNSTFPNTNGGQSGRANPPANTNTQPNRSNTLPNQNGQYNPNRNNTPNANRQNNNPRRYPSNPKPKETNTRGKQENPQPRNNQEGKDKRKD